jgi:ribosomal protein L29
MNDKTKQFFKVPQDIKTMTDEQLDQWADEIYQALFEEQKTTKEY